MLSARSSRPCPHAANQSASHRSLLSGSRARKAATVESSAATRPFWIWVVIRFVHAPPAQDHRGVVQGAGAGRIQSNGFLVGGQRAVGVWSRATGVIVPFGQQPLVLAEPLAMTIRGADGGKRPGAVPFFVAQDH